MEAGYQRLEAGQSTNLNSTPNQSEAAQAVGIDTGGRSVVVIENREESEKGPTICFCVMLIAGACMWGICSNPDLCESGIALAGQVLVCTILGSAVCSFFWACICPGMRLRNDVDLPV